MNFNIECTAADIELIGRLLDEQPYKTVADLAQRMQAQINAQLAAEQKSALDQRVAAELAKRTPPPTELPTSSVKG